MTWFACRVSALLLQTADFFLALLTAGRPLLLPAGCGFAAAGYVLLCVCPSLPLFWLFATRDTALRYHLTHLATLRLAEPWFQYLPAPPRAGWFLYAVDSATLLVCCSAFLPAFGGPVAVLDHCPVGLPGAGSSAATCTAILFPNKTILVRLPQILYWLLCRTTCRPAVLLKDLLVAPDIPRVQHARLVPLPSVPFPTQLTCLVLLLFLLGLLKLVSVPLVGTTFPHLLPAAARAPALENAFCGSTPAAFLLWTFPDTFGVIVVAQPYAGTYNPVGLNTCRCSPC